MSATTRVVAAAIVMAISNHAPLATAQSTASQAENTKKEALAWVDSFARSQALFHADDVKKLRERVATMAPDEAAKWWEKTAPQREVLSTPEWRETESWLKKFLAVQARYSDEEIRDFQSEAAAKAKESAASLQEVLDRVTQARRRLIAGAQASEATRQMELTVNEAYRQEQVRKREEALRQARTQSAATFPAPPVVREHPARFSAPLVDSLDVARWSVLRQLFPNW